MSGHSLLSPSSAPRWMRCPGSVAACYGVPDESSEYADEGTAAHELASRCLRLNMQARDFLGHVISVLEDGTCTDGEKVPAGKVRRSFEVTDEMADAVQLYVDAVRREPGAEKHYEQRVQFGIYIGVADQSGTSDAIVIDAEAGEIGVHDLKFGRGEKVDAKWIDEQGNEQPNEQLALYALGALAEHELVTDFERVKLAIHQPRKGADGHYDEHTLTRAELMAFAQSARAAAAEAKSGFAPSITGEVYKPGLPLPVVELDARGMLRPGQKQCRWCPMANGETGPECPALRRKALGAVYDANSSPIVIEELPAAELPRPDVLEVIELYLKGARSRIQRELQAGRKVAGWKLVRGKKGARQWAKGKLNDVLAQLKKWKVKVSDSHEAPKLKTPTQLEKVLDKARYAELAALYVTQSDGGEHVAPESDPAPEIQKTDVAALLGDDSDLV